MKFIYGDKTSGIGGNYSWTSKQGNGTLEIVESTTKSIKTKLSFEVGDGNSFGQWNLDETKDGHTKVTWGMTSDKDIPLIMRGMMAVME